MRLTRFTDPVTRFAAGVLFLHGCATMPEATSREMSMPQNQQVQLETVSGVVSNASSNVILGRVAGDRRDSDLLERHLAYEQAVNADSPLVLGNKLTLLQNGPATYAAMFEAIRGATDSINLETYIFADDVAGAQFSELLLERQAAGVQVNLIHDGVGSLATPKEFFERLQKGGVAVLEFNPVNPLVGNKRAWLLNNRDHRRQLIIDGRVAFTGGVNISDTYSSAPIGRRHKHAYAGTDAVGNGWRDTHLRIEGPVVAEFQKLFIDTWARQAGETLADREYFPRLENQGSEIVRAIGSTPEDPDSLIYLTLLSAINNAELTIQLTIAYFAPDPQLLRALTGAAERGVEIQLVLPSYTDSWPIFHLGRSHYSKLLRAGIRIYERRGSVMHAKTACIDGIWSTIGSTNLDWRSFLHNDEINAVILSRGFADQMETMFLEDVRQSDLITLEQWKQRAWGMRIKEQLARVGAYWL